MVDGVSDGGGLKSAPLLGADNVGVMKEIGLSLDQIEKLLAAGVLSTKTNDPKRLQRLN